VLRKPREERGADAERKKERCRRKREKLALYYIHLHTHPCFPPCCLVYHHHSISSLSSTVPCPDPSVCVDIRGFGRSVGLASLGYVFHSDSAFSSLLPRALFAVRFSYTRPSALQSCLGTAIEPPVLILIILHSHTLTLWVVLRLLFFVSVFIFASLTHSLTFSAVVLDRGSVC